MNAHTMPQEAMKAEWRETVKTAYRDAAYGLLRTAREYRKDGDLVEARRLVRVARWHMRQSVSEA